MTPTRPPGGQGRVNTLIAVLTPAAPGPRSPRPPATGAPPTPYFRIPLRPPKALPVLGAGRRGIERCCGKSAQRGPAEPLGPATSGPGVSGPLFLGHYTGRYAAAIYLTKARGSGLRVTPFPGLGGQAKAGKGSSLALWLGGVKEGPLGISGCLAGGPGSLGEAVSQVDLLDLAKKEMQGVQLNLNF